jgi:hypothetical protein
MVQKVTGFKTLDGQYFETEAEAVSHEKTLSLGEAVKAALVKLGFDGAFIKMDERHDHSFDLQVFLLNNSEALVEALTPPKKERKPRAPKDPAPTLTEVLTTIGGANTVNGATEVVTLEKKVETLVEVAPVNAEAGDAAEDELAALLGNTEVASTTEVAV